MEIGELFAEKGEPPRQNRSASDTKGSRISPRLVPRPADVSSGSDSDLDAGKRHARSAPINGHRQLGGALPINAKFGSDLISFYHLIGPSTDRSGRFSQSAALPPS